MGEREARMWGVLDEERREEMRREVFPVPPVRRIVIFVLQRGFFQ